MNIRLLLHYGLSLLIAYVLGMLALTSFSAGIDDIFFPNYIRRVQITAIIAGIMTLVFSLLGFRICLHALPTSISSPARKLHAAILVALPVVTFTASGFFSYQHSSAWQRELYLKQLKRYEEAAEKLRTDMRESQKR